MTYSTKRKHPKRHRKHFISTPHSDRIVCSKVNQSPDTYDCFDSERTLYELLNTWLDVNRLKHKPSTESKYRYMIDKHISPSLGHIRVRDITEKTLNGFLLEKLCSGGIKGGNSLSPAYVRTMMVILNSAMRLAYEEGMQKQIKAKIVFPSICQKPRIISVQEQKALEEYIIDHPTTTGTGVLLALRMGLRVGEICALTWKDIDFENKVLHVHATVVRDSIHKSFRIDKPKTESSDRYIPLSDIVETALLLCRKSNQGYIMSENSDFMRPNSFEYRYHRLLKDADIEDIRFHALRHTFATRCIEAGVDDKSLSELLGHSNVNITLNTYVHSSLSLKKKQMSKLSDYLEKLL